MNVYILQYHSELCAPPPQKMGMLPAYKMSCPCLNKMMHKVHKLCNPNTYKLLLLSTLHIYTQSKSLLTLLYLHKNPGE